MGAKTIFQNNSIFAAEAYKITKNMTLILHRNIEQTSNNPSCVPGRPGKNGSSQENKRSYHGTHDTTVYHPGQLLTAKPFLVRDRTDNHTTAYHGCKCGS